MRLLAITFIFVSGAALAGGSTGGSPGLLKEIMLADGGAIGGNPGIADIAFDVSSLPKSYVEAENFRRVKARLSVADVASVPMSIDGEEIQVRKLRDSIVDLKISKELLPDSN